MIKHCQKCDNPFDTSGMPARKYCVDCVPPGGYGPFHNNREARRRHDLKKRYGITVEDFDAMMDTQGGKCYICRADPPNSNKKRLSVDHNHETGEVRGLLCTKCNVMLGWFENNRDAVEDYLSQKV